LDWQVQLKLWKIVSLHIGPFIIILFDIKKLDRKYQCLILPIKVLLQIP
jgi:hypothetical protein